MLKGEQQQELRADCPLAGQGSDRRKSGARSRVEDHAELRKVWDTRLKGEPHGRNGHLFLWALEIHVSSNTL